MKNALTATAAIAALFAGTAAFAEGGYVDELGYIGANNPDIRMNVKHENANATQKTIVVTERGETHEINATVFVNDTTAVAQDLFGR
jgi:hypothetical protein